MTARLASRWLPLTAMAGLIVVGIVTSTWGVAMFGRADWALPDDLWRTLIAAQRLLHGDLSGLYTPPTELVSFPGAAVILVPAVAVIDAAGLPLQLPGPQNPESRRVAAGRALRDRGRVTGPVRRGRDRRAAGRGLAEAGGARRCGRRGPVGSHAAFRPSRGRRGGRAVPVRRPGPGAAASQPVRLARGAAVAVQPLVLLALPVLLAVIEPRRRPGFLARAAAPAAVLLGIAAAANWRATVTAVTSQPNSPAINHPTPWTSLAIVTWAGTWAAAWWRPAARALAILAACGCAVAAGRRGRAAVRTAGWSPEALAGLLWWIAVALALRSVFEPVMVAYYLWPVFAVALIPASRSWPRLAATSAAVIGLTIAAQAPWRDPWSWWVPMITGLALVLWLAHLPRAPVADQQPRATQAAARP